MAQPQAERTALRSEGGDRLGTIGPDLRYLREVGLIDRLCLVELLRLDGIGGGQRLRPGQRMPVGEAGGPDHRRDHGGKNGIEDRLGSEQGADHDEPPGLAVASPWDEPAIPAPSRQRLAPPSAPSTVAIPVA